MDKTKLQNAAKTRIWNYVSEHPGSSIHTIGIHTGVSDPYVKKYVKTFVSMGKMTAEREGSANTSAYRVYMTAQSKEQTPSDDKTVKEADARPEPDMQELIDNLTKICDMSFTDEKLQGVLDTLKDDIRESIKNSVDPCPFCGAEHPEIKRVGSDCAIHCRSCGISAAAPGGVAKLVWSWNKRA